MLDSEQGRSKDLFSEYSAWTVFVVIVLILLFIVKVFFINLITVEGTSMLPTYHEGQKVVMLKKHMVGAINRRDVIVFTDESSGDLLLKRVIGIQGDEVSITLGHVFLNGHILEEDYILDQYRDGDVGVKKWSIKENQVFVMGDNRIPGGSLDSRDLGPIEIDQIVGRVIK